MVQEFEGPVEGLVSQNWVYRRDDEQMHKGQRMLEVTYLQQLPAWGVEAACIRYGGGVLAASLRISTYRRRPSLGRVACREKKQLRVSQERFEERSCGR